MQQSQGPSFLSPMLRPIDMHALDPEVWGPHYWFMLHTIAFSYPDYPSSNHKKRFYEWIQTMPLFMPNDQCAKTTESLLSRFPVEPYLDSRTSLVKWAHFVHNKVNESIKKPIVTMDEFTRAYFELYVPKHLQMRDYYRWKEKMVVMGGVTIAVIAATYLYRKSVCIH